MAYIEWWNRTGPITMGERFGLNEISIARNTLSPTKSYTAKAPGNIPLMAPELSEDLTPMPNIPDLLREEGIQVGEQVKDGGRIDMKPGGIVEPGVTHYGMKEKHKAAYDAGYKFYKDKGIKITDNIEELIRKNVSVNKGTFIPPKFSGLLYEGISSRLPDYTLKMLKKDLKAGKTSHQIAIEYFKANKKNVLKNFEGTKQFKQPLSALSTTIGNIINKDKELSKLYKKIIKDNSFKSETGKAKYVKDIETLLPFIQEKGILVVDERGKAIKNANDYFRYAYRTVSEPISKLFGYYETIGIEHPAGVSRAVILEDANTLNRIIATIPETNTIKSELDKHATGQAKFFKNIGDSKYIKNLNKITKKMNEEFATPRIVTDVKKGEAVVRPMKELSLTKPNLFQQTKGYIMQKLAAGGFNKAHFNKLAPELQKAIKAFEGGNLIKGNKYLKAAMLAAGLVLTTAGTTREKGMTTKKMEEKTSQFLETGDQKQEDRTAVFPYDIVSAIAEDPKKTMSLAAPIAAGAAIVEPKKALEIAKQVGTKAGSAFEKIIRPLFVPAVDIGAAFVDTPITSKEHHRDVTSPGFWMTKAFWANAMDKYGITRTFSMLKNAPNFPEKARILRDIALRGIVLNPKAVRAVSKIAWPATAAASVYDSYKDYQRRKPFIEEQKELIKKGVIKEEEFDKDEPMFAMGGIASLLK